MTEITIEEIDIEKDNIKDAIIKILSHEYPLSAKIIYNKIKKTYRHQISYQGVYKAINQLIEKGILEKKEKNYKININWINQLEYLTKQLKQQYLEEKPLRLYNLKELNSLKEQITLEFETLYEADNYRKKLQDEYFKQEKEIPAYCGQSKHLKSPLVYSEKSLQLLKNLKEKNQKVYIIVNENDELDNYCANYYRTLNIKVKTGVKFESDCDIMILENLILQQYLPKELSNYINETYKNQQISNIDIKQFFEEIYQKKTKIKTIINNNKSIATQLRNNILKEFEENNQSAIFDIDGVLVKGFGIHKFLKYLTQINQFKPEIFLQFEHDLNQYKNKQITYTELAKNLIQYYADGLKGQQQKTILEHSKNFIKKHYNDYYEYTPKLLNHIKNKKKLIAITGSPIELMQIMNEDLNFDEIHATELIIKDGIYTGKIKKNLATYDEKTKTIQEYFQNNTSEGSIGFGDTESDISFLENVKIPIAINPNNKLKEHAKSNNWTILENENEVINKIKQIL